MEWVVVWGTAKRELGEDRRGEGEGGRGEEREREREGEGREGWRGERGREKREGERREGEREGGEKRGETIIIILWEEEHNSQPSFILVSRGNAWSRFRACIFIEHKSYDTIYAEKLLLYAGKHLEKISVDVCLSKFLG